MSNQNEQINRILILGNGFDLAHYLPTAYIHFMEAMMNIEKSNKEMGFEDIFSQRLKGEDDDFNKTKDFYKTEELHLNSKQVDDFKKKLKENSWFSYFKEHLSGIDTWIDFEGEIKYVLENLLEVFENNIPCGEIIEQYFTTENFGEKKQIYWLIFQSLRIATQKDFPNKYTTDKHWAIEVKHLKKHGKKILGLGASAIFTTLINELYEFNQIFSDYLNNIVQKLEPRKNFSPFDKLENVRAVYSFNYTDTFERFYPNLTDNIHHLHGVSTDHIVLGIDDISTPLQKMNAFGFVKGFQKIKYNTDYHFFSAGNAKELISKNDNEIIVFGHSLDLSDKDYVQAIFDLLEHEFGVLTPPNIILRVLYYGDSGGVLNNLMKVMGKEKILKLHEQGKIIFEEKPEIR